MTAREITDTLERVGSAGVSSGGPFVEQHFTVAEVAEMWHLSPDAVRKIFASEPGVLLIGRERRSKGLRRYRTIRIPGSVLERVHRRLSLAVGVR